MARIYQTAFYLSRVSMSHDTESVDPLTSDVIIVGAGIIGLRDDSPWQVPQRRSISAQSRSWGSQATLAFH